MASIDRIELGRFNDNCRIRNNDCRRHRRKMHAANGENEQPCASQHGLGAGKLMIDQHRRRRHRNADDNRRNHECDVPLNGSADIKRRHSGKMHRSDAKPGYGAAGDHPWRLPLEQTKNPVVVVTKAMSIETVVIRVVAYRNAGIIGENGDKMRGPDARSRAKADERKP